MIKKIIICFFLSIFISCSNNESKKEKLRERNLERDVPKSRKSPEKIGTVKIEKEYRKSI